MRVAPARRAAIRPRLRGVLYPNFLRTAPGEAPLLRIYLCGAKPEKITATLDGEARAVYRCPSYACGGEMDWVSWRSGQIGRCDEDNVYPVYFQGHALRQLLERLPIEDAKGIMWHSLADPQIVDFDGRKLVACRVGDLRLGYFPIHCFADKVIVVTFLFLTMRGTPEARLLYEKLRLCRRDIEH